MTEKKESASTNLTNSALSEIVELWKSNDDLFATIQVDQHYENHALNSKGVQVMVIEAIL